MITYSALGAHGRLGNQLFQIAATIAHAMRMRVAYRFPPWISSPYFSIPERAFAGVPSLAAYKQRIMGYEPIPEDIKDLDLHGGFISWKYFADFTDTIREHLAPPEPVKPIDAIAVHVRRGDQALMPEKYVQLGREYYAQAMHIMGSATFLVFSDDIPWCRNFFGRTVMYSGGFFPEDDLHRMAACKAHIISNSTFAWWGAWLSGRSDVIAPRHYHTEALLDRHSDVRDWEQNDYYPPGWVLL